MPWEHYVVDSLNNMALDMPVTYKNNHSATYGVFYKYQVIDNNGSGPVLETYPPTTSAKNANAYSALIEPQAVYNTSPVFVNDFYYPPTNDTTKVFQIKKCPLERKFRLVSKSAARSSYFCRPVWADRWIS